jgi:hypothetical protein
MRARLKLKEIDGRAPQGVNAVTPRQKATLLRVCECPLNNAIRTKLDGPRQIAGNVRF